MDANYIELIPYFTGEYRFLSNFYEVPVAYGAWYPNAECAYQAQKTTDMKLREVFQNLSAYAAKSLGRSLKLRDDWEQVKDQEMLAIVRRKFQQPTLREKLGHTGYKYLVEGNNWHDVYWGVCDGKCKHIPQHPGIAMGRNVLGKILEQVRSENREAFIATNYSGIEEAALSGTVTGLE